MRDRQGEQPRRQLTPKELEALRHPPITDPMGGQRVFVGGESSKETRSQILNRLLGRRARDLG